MIGTLALIGGAAAITYLTRVSGFLVAGKADHAPRSLATKAVDRFLFWAPVAAFTALIVPDLASGPGIAPARLVGAGCAALAIWRFERLWLGLAAGFAAFWAIQLLASAI